MNEQEVLFEKRRLENELKNRDSEVDDLNQQVLEKETELKKMGKNKAENK